MVMVVLAVVFVASSRIHRALSDVWRLPLPGVPQLALIVGRVVLMAVPGVMAAVLRVAVGVAGVMHSVGLVHPIVLGGLALGVGRGEARRDDLRVLAVLPPLVLPPLPRLDFRLLLGLVGLCGWCVAWLAALPTGGGVVPDVASAVGVEVVVQTVVVMGAVAVVMHVFVIGPRGHFAGFLLRVTLVVPPSRGSACSLVVWAAGAVGVLVAT